MLSFLLKASLTLVIVGLVGSLAMVRSTRSRVFDFFARVMLAGVALLICAILYLLWIYMPDLDAQLREEAANG